MKLAELFLNRFLYRDNTQNLETKDSAFVSADSSESEPTPIPSGGAAQDINMGNVTINGAQLTPGTFPQTVLDVSNWGWGQTCIFTSTDSDTVSWGTGVFKSADGTTYNISAGNTGNMTVKTYIYLSLLDSTTTYLTTTIPATSVGVGKVLVAVANPDTTTATYNLSEATQIVGDNILANTINASKITTGQLVVGTNIGQGTARQNFYSTPTTPYYLNDLWTDGTNIKVCTTQRLTGAYNAADWGAASTYDNTQAQLTAGADISNAKANGTTLITGGYISTGIITATNIQTGILTGIKIQTSSSNYVGVKMSSALGGIVVYDLAFELRDGSNTLYGYIGTDAGYYKITTSGNRNMFLSAGTGHIYSDSDFLPLTNGIAMLGDPSYTWNTIYGGNVCSNNYYDANGSYRLYYSSSKWQVSTDFKVNGSVNITGNLVFDNEASITINGRAYYQTTGAYDASKYYLRS